MENIGIVMKSIWNKKILRKLKLLPIMMISAVIFGFAGAMLEYMIGGGAGVGIAICLFALYVLAARRVSLADLTVGWMLISVVYAYYLGGALGKEVAVIDQVYNHNMEKYAFLWPMLHASLSLMCMLCIGEFLSFCYKKIEGVKNILLGIVILNTMFFIFIPVSVMVGNVKEYSFPVYTLIASNMLAYITCILVETLILAALVKKHQGMLANIISGLILCIYAQIMFMNFNIGEIEGASYEWNMHMPQTAINCVVWIVLLMAPFVAEHLLRDSKVFRIYVPLFLFGIQFVAFGSELITAPYGAYQYRQYTYAGEEQFVVSSDENVVMFVFDAGDNRFIKELMEHQSYDFEPFKDFCLYTDTCSVFDATLQSLPQMMTAGTYQEYPMNYIEAYNRMKNAGYTINFYGYEGDEPEDLFPYIDNYRLLSTDENVVVSNFGIFLDSAKLTSYLTVPDVLKKWIPTDKINFYDKVQSKNVRRFYYENEEFAAHVDVQVNPESKHYFVMEHFNGIHEPNAGFEITTIECMNIVKDYMEQLKAYGLYDNATIIITADHGIHDEMKSFPYETAATPMFMIKMPHQKNDEMQISNAPIYHTDLLPTIVYAMGLYGEDGREQFGKTVFDYEEDEKRERIFYNRAKELNYYHKYTYTGDTKTLEEMVENGQYEVVKWGK